jgi:Tol biopolymer transport system component
MKRTLITGLVLAAALAAPLSMIGQDQKAGDLLQQGRIKEEIDFDLPGAIALYEQATTAAGANRELVALSLLRLGKAYKRLANTKAREYLSRVAVEYAADSKEAAEEARKLLAAMGGAAVPNTVNPTIGADADPSAHITFDGRYLSRPDWETGGVVIRDMSTGHVRRLMVKNGSWETSDAFAANAILSPDGRRVVYSWFPGNKTGPNNYQLWIAANADNPSPTVLVENGSGAYCCFEPIGWSSNGQSLLVTVSKPDHTWALAWVSLAGGTVKEVQSLGWRLRKDRPSLSPDGMWIAYSALSQNPGSAVGRNEKLPSSASTEQHIYILRTDGLGKEKPLVVGANINESPVWTPDGKQILFISNRSRTGSFAPYAIAVENGEAIGGATLLPMSTGRISPIGITRSGSLYYVSENATGGFDVFVADMDPNGKVRGKEKRLLDDHVDWNRAPAWSPDGTRIAFKRLRAQGDSAFDLVVYTVGSDRETLLSDREKVYTYSGVDGSPPVWFHDSKSLLISRENAGGRLFRVDLETDDLESVEAAAHFALPTGFLSATLSPDDKILYMTIAEKRVVRIVGMDLATGDEKKIWSSQTPLKDPPNIMPSPDGRELAMTLQREEWRNTHLVRMSVDGGGYQDLAESVATRMFAWTADRAILFAAIGTEKSQIMRIAAHGARPEPIGLVLSQACACGHTMSLNPDGSKLVFSDGTREGGALWELPNISAFLRAAR